MGFVGLLVFALSLVQVHAENILIKKLQTVGEIRAEYCRISTGSGTYGPDCGMQYGEERLDVIYLPLEMAQKIVGHIQSAFDKKYYFNLSKKDLFHGHLLARGPQTLYQTAEEYLSDARLILYHSQEYLNNWVDIEGPTPFVSHEQQRSFVGWFSEASGVDAAIDLINPNLLLQANRPQFFLRGYKEQGTIYLNELNDSVKESLHDYSYGGPQLSFYLKSDEPSTNQCELFQMIYILEDAQGRFVSADGKRFDMTLHCRYRRS